MWKRLWIVLLGTSLMFSCKTADWCAKNCPKTTVIVDKTKDSTGIKVDTTWKTYYNPADSLSMANKLFLFMDSLDQCHIKNASGTTESNKIKIKYIVRNDSIFIEANTKPYEIKIAELTTTIDHFREIYHSYTETAAYSNKKPSWFSYWQTWMALGYIALSVTRLILKALKFKVAVTLTPPFIMITKQL